MRAGGGTFAIGLIKVIIIFPLGLAGLDGTIVWVMGYVTNTGATGCGTRIT